MSNPSNDSQFDQNDKERDNHCHVEAWNQERQRMADPTDGCHRTADQSPDPGVATSREAAVIRQCLRKSHAYACTEGCGQSDKKRIPRVSSCESSGEHWG